MTTQSDEADLLMNAFSFTESDLAANVKGELTERQVIHLKEKLNQHLRTNIYMVGVVILIVTSLTLYESPESLLDWIPLLWLLICCAAAFGISHIIINKDLRAGRLKNLMLTCDD